MDDVDVVVAEADDTDDMVRAVAAAAARVLRLDCLRCCVSMI